MWAAAASAAVVLLLSAEIKGSTLDGPAAGEADFGAPAQADVQEQWGVLNIALPPLPSLPPSNVGRRLNLSSVNFGNFTLSFPFPPFLLSSTEAVPPQRLWCGEIVQAQPVELAAVL